MRIIKKALVCLFVFTIIASLLSIHASAITIYDGAFGFDMDTMANEALLTEYKGTDTDVSIPAYCYSVPVTVVAEKAFQANTDLRHVSFPTSIKSVRSNAFQGCSSLQEVKLNNHFTFMGEGVFRDCTSLQSAVINANLSAVPKLSFYNCSSLTSVSLGENVTEIGYGAFINCTALTELSGLDHISVLNEKAFYHTGLERVILSDELTSIPDEAFAECANLSYVELPAGVNEVSSTAFYNDADLTLGVWYGSYGHEYAVENGIDYILLDGVLLGDANADEKVDVADVTKIQQFIAELTELDGIYLKAADANCDGNVDIADATIVQMYVAEYDTGFPIGEPITK